MARPTSRRTFVKTSALAGVGFWAAGGVARAQSNSPNEKIQFASIGVTGKGSSDSEDAGQNGDMVAICDIDDKNLAAGAARFPSAEKFHDFREMLDKMGDKIDAVTVSTPDHCHAVAAYKAMSMGKHCFCQKPLTHSIYEARRLGEVAREKGVATQMGNQGTSEDGVRKAAALLQAGVIGTVKEVHVWTNRPIWPQGGPRPAESPIPSNLKWELWLGPAAYRPYSNGYHPFAWRGWWDFGTGALGDMACHTFNMPFMGLGLKNPTSVVAKTAGHNKDSYPKWSIIDFEFPANDTRPALKVSWYDGGKLPDVAMFGEGRAPKDSGCLIVGDQGKIYSPNDYGAEFELIDAEMKDVEFKKSPGHFDEWVNAIRGGEQAMSNFSDYAGPLSETILLGNLAVWADGKKIEWDAKNLKATNAPEVDSIIKNVYRDGYTIDG
ncbi:MAG: Gfo/Idh/MocA family oxidoreductase [Planctomycetia bacterium]|nr:Gfo/Idh/MocA family oxidoreductase [Planctomycetia bacterium]